MKTIMLPPIVGYVQATLDKKDAERRQDEYRADAMGEVLTLHTAGKKALALDRELIIVQGGHVLDVHGTLKAIAKARGIPDVRDQSAVENLLTYYCAQHHVDLVFTKRADSLRVI